tara:strand:- start:221 stop:631 length:411 start_codon:yes stop_codon:yes gene_type:complete
LSTALQLPYRSTKKYKRGKVIMNKYLGILIIVVIVVGGFTMGGGIDRGVDLLSFIFVIGIGIGHAFGSKDGESTITRFGDGCVRGGWLGLLVGITLIAATDFAGQMDFTKIMPALAVALLAPLYGYFLKILTMQLD